MTTCATCCYFAACSSPPFGVCAAPMQPRHVERADNARCAWWTEAQPATRQAKRWVQTVLLSDLENGAAPAPLHLVIEGCALTVSIPDPTDPRAALSEVLIEHRAGAVQVHVWAQDYVDGDPVATYVLRPAQVPEINLKGDLK